MGKIGLVSSVHKIELLFIFSLLVSIIPVNSLLKSSFLLTLFILFHRGYRIKTFLSILILFILLNNFSAFVVDKNLNNDGSFSYYSVNGSLKGDYLNVGDVIVGRFKTENRGNFIQYIVEQEFFRMRVPIYSYLIELRDRKVENLYFLSNKKITLLLAVFYGEKRYISDEVNELFTIAGLNHLLAISGQHVGIILMMIFIFLYRIDFKIRFLIGMISVVLFIPIAGFKIPVIRAAIFVTILAFTYLFDRKVVLRKLVLWVAVTFMIVDPDIIYSPSFCLSFLAVLGISLISDDFFKENKFINSILVGIYATAFTLPYIAYKFGIFNIASVLNTILYSPIISAIILTGMVSIFSTTFVIPFEIYFEQVAISFLKFLSKVTDFAFMAVSIDFYILLVCIAILVVGYFYRRIYIILLTFFILFLPAKKVNGLFLPKMKNSQGYLLNIDGVHEIFFKGNSRDFRYIFLPFVSKVSGRREFDYGDIDLPYNSKIIKIRFSNEFTNNVCFNSNGCPFVILNDRRKFSKLEFLDNITYINYLKEPIIGAISINYGDKPYYHFKIDR